jgi:class 3 adenylate cyclase
MSDRSERSETIRYLRERATRLRDIARQNETEVSAQLRQMADDLEQWASHLEARV